MAVQSRLPAGTGPRWESTAVSRSQWLFVMLVPMISMRNGRPEDDAVEKSSEPEYEQAGDRHVEARLEHRAKTNVGVPGQADPAADAGGESGTSDKREAECETPGEPPSPAHGSGEQVVQVAGGLLAARGSYLARGCEGENRTEVKELVTDPCGGAASLTAEANDRLTDRVVTEVRLSGSPGDH